MIRRTLALWAIGLGLLCLVLVSCKDSRPVSSLFTAKDLKEDLKEVSHFGFTPARVSLLVHSHDAKLKDELNHCLASAFESVKGITLVTSDPLYKVEVLVLPLDDEIAASVAIVEMTASCRGCLVSHHILAGDKDRLKELCQKVVDTFETKQVAPFR